MAVELNSMTGFGSCSVKTDIGNIQVEVKSVNSRFLDVSVQANNEAIRQLEPQLKKLITDDPLIKRGKVDCHITVTRAGGSSVGIDTEALKDLIALQKTVRKQVKSKEMTTAEILLFPGILNSKDISEEDLSKDVFGALKEALKKFNESRRAEGTKLAGILVAQCDEIDKLVTNLRTKIPDIVNALEQKLTKRLEDALSERLSNNSSLSAEEVNERICQEVTLFATKIDVAEEMDRLMTHTANVRETLKKGGAVGRKLDFVIQELNREANTLGSKAASIEMTDTAIELKLHIEQMREQIQNMQ